MSGGVYYVDNDDHDMHLSSRSDLHLNRKFFHACAGTMILYADYTLDRNQMISVISFCAFGLALGEFLRFQFPAFNELQKKVLGPIMRRQEVKQISGMTFYMAGSLMALLCYSRNVFWLVTMYQAYGDPVASAFGIKYGNWLPRLPWGKSPVGTAAAVVVNAVCSMVFLLSSPFGNNVKVGDAIIATSVGSVLGGLIELFTGRGSPLLIDDNFTIPVVAGGLLTVLQRVVGGF